METSLSVPGDGTRSSFQNHAAKCQSPEIVDLLLIHGADPTPKDKHGYNAESIAAWYGEYRMCAYSDASKQMQKRLKEASFN